MLCKNCNSEISDDSKICPICGTDLMSETPDSTKSHTNEANAEDTIDETEYFDSGNTQDDAESSDEPLTQNELNRQKQIDEMTIQKKSQLEEIEDRRNQKKRKQKRNRIITICVLAALVIAAGSTAAYLIHAGFSNGTPIVISTPTPTETPEIHPDDATPDPNATISPDVITPAPVIDTENEQNTSSSGSGSNNTSNNSSAVSGNSSSSSSSGSSSGGKTSSGSSSSGKTSSGSSSGKSTGNGTSSSSAAGNTGSSSSSGNKAGNSSSAKEDSSSSKLIYGSKVFSDNDKTLFEFTSNGTTYIANVSSGSSTADVKDKYFTATLVPTNKKYNGKIIYDIVHMTDTASDGYILPDSATRLLTSEDLKDISKELLPFARNEIYARHGRKFTKRVYADYFETRPWYSVNPSYNYNDDNKNLSEIEKQNVLTILNAEKQ